MNEVRIPTPDVTSDAARIVRWLVADGSNVGADDVILEAETSKAIFDVHARHAGILVHAAPAGATVRLDAPVAWVAADAAEAAAATAARDRPTPVAANADLRVSAPARRRAAELGVDLATIRRDGMITVSDVEAAAAHSLPPFLAPLDAPAGVVRVVLIGGGNAAMQVMEILRTDAGKRIVGIVDDTPAKRGRAVQGIPVIGPTSALGELRRAGAFDAAICAFGAPVEARRRFREVCAREEIPLANAIDPTARIASDATIGAGNVVCAFVHLGTGAVLGDNNFLSAYNSYDHHARIGDDCSTGPGCMASGNVTIGSRVRLGTGIFVQPGVRIGDGAQVASGAVIVSDVPERHAVKTRVAVTATVPLDASGPGPAAAGASAG